MDFNIWLSNLRGVLQEEGSPLSLNNGRWEVTERKKLWQVVGSRIFDSHLDDFKHVCLRVLTEVDPQFELEPAVRYSASIYGKVLKYSPDLRRGLSETLALLGSESKSLINCSKHKPENVAVDVVHSLLASADWRLWGSLSELLPVLAEAAPSEFLNCVESALRNERLPFAKLFAEGRGDLTYKNYMVGLLWALEALGWVEEYFMRVVVILAELAAMDPGGNSGNKPINSIKTMLLPWFPQTFASGDKRIASLKAVKEEFPEIAWDVLKGLLPTQHQTSMGTYKPRWILHIAENEEVRVSNSTYRDQVAAYAELAVEMSVKDLSRLQELVGNLDNLPSASFDVLLTHLSSDQVRGLDESERLPIWSSLTKLVAKHRRFSDSDWALTDGLISVIEDTAANLAPVRTEVLYRRLFSSRDFDLYEEKGDWERQRKNLEEKRKRAVLEILNTRGLQGVMEFLDSVESADLVGWALGVVGPSNIDSELIPEYLNVVDFDRKKFISSFIWSRNFIMGVEWPMKLDRRGWTLDQTCQFLMCLPFDVSTWELVDSWLGAESDQYWLNVTVSPYQGESDTFTAIDRLLDVSRPREALECLSARLIRKLPFDSKRTSKALIEAVSKQVAGNMDSYEVAELIKALQNDPSTNPVQLFNVEWAYLSVLGLDSEIKPKFLQRKLATEPDFFVEIVRMIYRSKDESEEDIVELNEQEKAIAVNAWRLLNEWNIPPGFMDDLTFDTSKLQSWQTRVKQLCLESGHYDVAMLKFGEVLYYCPPDASGLWIVNDAAKILNARDGDALRSGFCTEVFNSRGAHWVDPTGAAEKELSQLWRNKAEAVENVGFPRFAASLRELAESYDRQAERVVQRQAGRH